MYDTIVVGARCAGAATAMLLARKGYRVLLVDRAAFPSDIPHGHFIHQHGPRRLHQWGLLDRIVSTNCPPVDTITVDLGDFPLIGKELTQEGIAMGYGPRRSVLDRLLIEAAVEAGAEFRDRFLVEGFTSDREQVTGISGRDTRSRSRTSERATLTVGADGRNSALARSVQAPVSDQTPSLTCWYFSYWSGVPTRGLEIYVRQNRALFGFPTNDGLFALFVGWPHADLGMVRGDIERQFMAVVDRVPDLAQRIRNGRREERFYGASDLPNFLRKPYGPGWALVGDAGCHKDPYLALGVCDAFRDAELLAEAVEAGLSGREPLEAALGEYERRRNEATRADYSENIHLAQFKPLPPEAYQLRAALRDDQEATNRYFMAREGMIPREAFFHPDNLERLMRKTGLVAVRESQKTV